MYNIADGLDTYTSTADATANVGNGGGWSSSAHAWFLSNRTPFAMGQALTTATSVPGPLLLKTGLSNHADQFVALRFLQTAVIGAHSGNPGLACQWLDGTTPQCTIHFCFDGTIKVYSGDVPANGGALVATSPVLFVAN